MAACADAGLLVLTCGRQHEVVRWIPPLDVSAAEVSEAVEIFAETLGVDRPRLSGEPGPSPAACAGHATSAREDQALGEASQIRVPAPAPADVGDQRCLAVLGQELHHVVKAEATIASLADAIEGQLTAVTKTLHRVDMQVQHLGDLGRSEHRSQFIDGHRCHVVVASVLRVSRRSGSLGCSGVGSGPLRGRL